MASRNSPTAGRITAFSRYRERLARHPWRAFLLLMALQAVGFALACLVVYGVFRVPVQLPDMDAFSTVAVFTLGGLLGYVVMPFLLGLPSGARGFKEYLHDIRLTRARPWLPLLALTATCIAILIACRAAGSLVAWRAQGNLITIDVITRVLDVRPDLPPRSMRLFAQLFSSLEEVAFRGVLLTMLLRMHPPARAIVYSAAAFGLMHLPTVFTGPPVVFVLGQAAWAFLYGVFYGYIFIKSGSLLPSMAIHWLSNVLHSPSAVYLSIASVPLRTLYSVVFGYGLAALLSIAWVRVFSARWLEARAPSWNAGAGMRARVPPYTGEDAMDNLQSQFDAAAAASKQLPKRPDNDTMLKLYALFKQATSGDASGTRPGGFDFVGQAKYDAWAAMKGTPAATAMQGYVDLVNSLKG